MIKYSTYWRLVIAIKEVFHDKTSLALEVLDAELAMPMHTSERAEVEAQAGEQSERAGQSAAVAVPAAHWPPAVEAQPRRR